MKVIILAAGRGSRLRPLTDNQPKCMVSYHGKPLISYALERLNKKGIKDIAIVTGYKAEVLKNYLKNESIKYFYNPSYSNTNMIYSLNCAKDFLTDDVVILYSDIIFSIEMLDKLIDSDEDISVIIDKNWRALWEFRMEDPLADLEVLQLNDECFIKEIGGKADSYNDIQGQFVGMLKVKQKAMEVFLNHYRDITLTNKDVSENIYTTEFLQQIINKGMPVKAILTNAPWIEVDTVDDLNKYEKESYFP